MNDPTLALPMKGSCRPLDLYVRYARRNLVSFS